jgi:ABC-type phosphate/phosphonate transport system substrate-binding protein
MTDYQALGQAWRANKYDAVLADACQKAGYPSNFASHDLRVLAVTAALNNSG